MPAEQGTESGLTRQQKKTLLRVARETIEKATAGKPHPSFEFDDPLFREERGAFVTIHKNDDLRGCIGYVRAMKPLLETIIEMAEAAALHDPRFHPVQPDEVKDLEIEISVLTPLRKIEKVDEIQVGVHGLMLENGISSGLLLPQVATEYNWDRDTFLEHTCMKAGLPHDAWKDKNTKIYVFSADVFSEKEFD
ncbi:MAG: AmmeMemoRadiSam system protein A [Actinobacteria bacterium]|nr:AmmeMemoRadiSam system protein A [Actinomycetota bacterium]